MVRGAIWAGACAVLLAGATAAHEFSCESRVNGEVIHEVNHYPAKLRLRFTVRNTHPTDASTALAVRDGILERLGLTGPLAPFTLEPAGKLVREAIVRVVDRAQCLELTGAPLCGTSLDDVFELLHDSGATQCRARIVCGEEKRHCAEGDEACESSDDHTDTVGGAS